MITVFETEQFIIGAKIPRMIVDRVCFFSQGEIEIRLTKTGSRKSVFLNIDGNLMASKETDECDSDNLDQSQLERITSGLQILLQDHLLRKQSTSFIIGGEKESI